MGQKIHRTQIVENAARYYAYQSGNMTTTSGAYVAFTPNVSITTKGGALEMELDFVGQVSAATAFVALRVNGVDYQVVTLSNTGEVGYHGKVKTPALPAGTYTVQMYGYINAGATLTIPAYRSQTIYVKEVAVNG